LKYYGVENLAEMFNAKKKVFKHFKVIKWEDIPVTKYNAVDAFIDGLEKDELAS
jgi:hypothetical protein